MVSLVNKAFRGKSLVTSWGKIEFSAEGVAKVEDVVGEKLSKLTGFSLASETSTPNNGNGQKNENTTSDDQNTATNETKITPDNQEDENDENKTITAEELDAMNVPQLKKYAKEVGIDVTNINKKQELVDAILAK